MSQRSKSTGMPHDRRAFSRVHYANELLLKASSGESYAGILHDVSLKGMLFHCDHLPPKGMTVTGTLALGSITLTIKGLVVNSQPGRGAAVLFQDMDVESFSHLRRLVALNLGDSDIIDEEFFATL
ncbi:MAG: PilZ domain-containing protein [Magnetococcus sp. YQC-5]